MARLLFILLLITAATHLSCQDESNSEISWINVNHTSPYGTFHTGLSIDSLGYTWMVGNGGLHVFDGKKTITYFGKDEKYKIIDDSLGGDFISMVKDLDGNFWVNTRYKSTLIKFDPIRRKVLKILNADKTQSVNSNVLRINEDNELVYLTYDYGDETYKLYSYNEAQGSNLLYTHDYIQQGEKKRVYKFFIYEKYYVLLSEDRIILISHDGTSHKLIDRKTPLGKLSKIQIVQDDLCVLFDNSNQCLCYDFDKDNWVRGNEIFPSNEYEYTTLQQIDNYIFAGTFNHLYIKQLGDDNIKDLSQAFVDTRTKFTPLQLTSEIVQFEKIGEDKYYILTSDNLYKLDYGGKVDIGDFFVSMPYPYVKPSMRQLAMLNDGSIVASYYGGLAIKKPQSDHFDPYPLNNSANHGLSDIYRDAYSLEAHKDHLYWNNAVIDAEGNLSSLEQKNNVSHAALMIYNDTLYSHTWYDNKNEILRYDIASNTSEKLKVRDVDGNPLSVEMVNKMIMDGESEHILLATYLGILETDKELVVKRHFLPEDLLCTKGDGIFDMLLQDDILWYACKDGLGSLDLSSGKVQMYKIPFVNRFNILDSKVVWSIFERDNSSLYIGTEVGLYHFDVEGKRFNSLPAEHPLSNVEFNRNSTFRDEDELYFGTTNGLFTFKEQDLTWSDVDEDLGPITITSIIVNGKDGREYISEDISSNEVIHLSPSDNNLNIHFSSLNDKKDAYYAYRILELDSTWTRFDNDNILNIFSMPSGSNTLEIKASNYTDTGNSTQQTIYFDKAEYWYKTWWASLLYLILAISLVVLIYRYRINQILKYQKLRTRISSDLHDEVGSLMSGISMQAEMMAHVGKSSDKSMLNELSDMSKDAMGKMRDIVWALDARRDNLEDLILKMKEFAEYQLGRKGIHYTFETSGDINVKRLNPEHRQNIYLIFAEGITNIVKHSSADMVNILLHNDKNGLALHITNNGVDTEVKQSSGQGLTNMKMRSDRIGGTIDISSDASLFRVAFSLNSLN